MRQPDTLIAKYFFLVFVGFLVFFIFSVMMWVLKLGGQCSVNAPPQEEKKKKKGNTIIYLIIFVIVCSMAAQAVNQSYQKIIPKVTTSIK
jgi:hypothetical protein